MLYTLACAQSFSNFCYTPSTDNRAIKYAYSSVYTESFSNLRYTHQQIVKGSEPIEIRAPPVVQVSLNLAVSIDDFFDPTALIYNLAFVLKIDVSRIRIVEIIAEDSPVGKRSLLSADEFSQTSITFEFGDPPAMNISSPETPSVAEEVAMAGGDEESVDIEVRLHASVFVSCIRSGACSCKNNAPGAVYMLLFCAHPSRGYILCLVSMLT